MNTRKFSSVKRNTKIKGHGHFAETGQRICWERKYSKFIKIASHFDMLALFASCTRVILYIFTLRPGVEYYTRINYSFRELLLLLLLHSVFTLFKNGSKNYFLLKVLNKVCAGILCLVVHFLSCNQQCQKMIYDSL